MDYGESINCILCKSDIKLKRIKSKEIYLCNKHYKYKDNPSVYYTENIEQRTLKNENYREVLYTDKNIQLTVMSITPKDYNIEREKHENLTQFIRIESGEGQAIINDNYKQPVKLTDGISLIIPENTFHEIINTSKGNGNNTNKTLKLYSIYSKPVHEPNKIEVRKNKIK